MKRQLAITATAALLLFWARTTWGEPRSPGLDAARSGWAAGLTGGISTELGVAFNTRGVVGLTADRVLDRRLRLDLGLRFAPKPLGLRMDLTTGAALQLGWGRFGLTAGLAAGISVVHVASETSDETVWTAALLLQPGVELSVVLLPHLELRANLITLSMRYNVFWMPSWDPTLALLYRF